MGKVTKGKKPISKKELQKLARAAIESPKCDGPCHGSGTYLGSDINRYKCWQCDGTGFSKERLEFRDSITPERFLELFNKPRSPRKPKYEEPTKGEMIGAMLKALAR